MGFQSLLSSIRSAAECSSAAQVRFPVLEAHSKRHSGAAANRLAAVAIVLGDCLQGDTCRVYNGGMVTVDVQQLVQFNLGEEMRKQGLSQSELSRRSGVRQATISLILRGKAKPTLDVIGDLCVALNVPAAQFFLEPAKKSA